MSRDVTCKLLEMMLNGELDPRTVANACLNFMSEYEVGNMAHNEELLLKQDRNEDEEEEVDDDNDDEDNFLLYVAPKQ
jgi:hypothetical protein